MADITTTWRALLRTAGRKAEGYATVKVAIRHKRRLPTGFPPFISFARLTFVPPSAQGVTVTFSFEKVVLFSGE